MIWSVDEILKATGAELKKKGAGRIVDVSTDTRASQEDKLFIALEGERFDAHDFLDKAVSKGAGALLVHKDIGWDDLPDKVSVFRVQDTLKALQDLATWRRQKSKIQVLGITGSNGKTSTKAFAKTIIGSEKKVYADAASFNNHIGVPLNLLAFAEDDEVVLSEMGMNHLGELTQLSEIARPDVVLVTMVGRAHIGELGSQAGVARAKAELYESNPEALKIFNLDNQFTAEMKQKYADDRSLTFSSFSELADVGLRAEVMDLSGLLVSGSIGGVAGRAKVPIYGRHNVTNLMAAAALALAAGLSPEKIWAALPNCGAQWGRNQIVELQSGAKVLFDAYNANPESMDAAVKNLFEIDTPGKKILVFAEMLELGAESASAHHQLGDLVARSGADIVWFYGAHSRDFEAGLAEGKFPKTSFISDSYEQSLAIKIGSMIHRDDIVVLKGSRGMALEQVLHQWKPVNF